MHQNLNIQWSLPIITVLGMVGGFDGRSKGPNLKSLIWIIIYVPLLVVLITGVICMPITGHYLKFFFCCSTTQFARSFHHSKVYKNQN